MGVSRRGSLDLFPTNLKHGIGVHCIVLAMTQIFHSRTSRIDNRQSTLGLPNKKFWLCQWIKSSLNIPPCLKRVATLPCDIYTVSQKTSHLWLAMTLTYVNEFWYFWQKYMEKRENCIFLKCCITALPEFNQLLDFFNLFDSRPHTHVAVWLLKSCNQCVQLGTVGGMVQEKGSR